MGHFYLDDPPRPFYEIEYSDKKRAGEMRPVTVKDARKVGAYPSPNETVGILDKPGLLYWNLQLMADAVHDVVISLGGDWDTYGWSESYNLYKERKEVSSKMGTEIHNVIEYRLNDNVWNEDCEKHKDIIRSVLEWLSYEDIIPTGIEEVFVNKTIGIGGKIDVVDRDKLTIVDWKTINTFDKEIRQYPKDKTPLLAAYSMGIFGTLDTKLWNVFISRDEPGKIIPKLYTKEEIEYGWKKFQLCYKLWIHDKGYDPRLKE